MHSREGSKYLINTFSVSAYILQSKETRLGLASTKLSLKEVLQMSSATARDRNGTSIA